MGLPLLQDSLLFVFPLFLKNIFGLQFNDHLETSVADFFIYRLRTRHMWTS